MWVMVENCLGNSISMIEMSPLGASSSSLSPSPSPSIFTLVKVNIMELECEQCWACLLTCMETAVFAQIVF